MKEPNKAIYLLIVKFGIFLLALACFVLLIFFLLPYEKASWIVNRFASDGNVEIFSQSLFSISRIPALLVFGVIFAITILALVQFNKTQQFFINFFRSLQKSFVFFRTSWTRLILDLFRFFDRETIHLISIISLFAILIRVILIHQPMGHDESYSSVIFAFEPLYKGLSDYHFPNNHVFHTLFVHIAVQIFGPQEWAVRLPALISGVLLVPGSHILAKTWYGKKVALISAFLVASFPELIEYSVNARGYTLMAFLTILMLICANYARLHKNSAAWFLVGFFGALGFYTLPIMAYPLGIAYSWLGLSWLAGDFNKDYSKFNFFISVLRSGIFSVVLGLAFYIPIFKNWGIKSLLANEYTQALEVQAFKETLMSRLLDTWRMIDKGIIPYIGIFLIAGYLLSFLRFRKIGKIKIPIQMTSLLVISILVAIQRPNIYYRTWIFFIPLLLIWSVAGWMSITTNKTVIPNLSGKPKIATILGIFIAFIFTVNGVFHVMKLAPSAKNRTGDVEQATLFLQNQLNKNDIVVITATDDARMWFYFEKYGLSRTYFSRTKPFDQAFIIINNKENQTIPFVISDRGPDKGFFDMESIKKLKTINSLDIYVIKANAEAVSKAYGDWK